MRMFLVCMCDIFLILYLTNLGQVDRNAVSDLTVADYLKLKEAEEKLQQSIEEQRLQLAALGVELGKAQAERAQKTVALTEKEKELKRAAEEAALAKEAHSDEISRANELRQELEAAEAKKAAAARELKLAREASEAERLRLLDIKKNKEQVEAELRNALEKAAEEKKRAEEERKKAEEARLAAEKAAREREKAELERKQAEESAKKAEDAAAAALAKEVAANARAKEARELALNSKVKAIAAEKKARVASTREKKAKQVLETVVQPKEEAYRSNIARRLVSVVIRSKYENMLIGSSRDKIELRGVIAEVGTRQAVFVPLQDSGVLEKDIVHRAKRYEVEIDGMRVKDLLVMAEDNRLIGFVVPDAKRIPRSHRPEKEMVKGLMPTLFAIRSQEPRNFSDRIRSVSSDFFVFKRDRLESGKNNTLEFQAEGFRGTGDFGERVVTGDTVVDFAGNVIAIATSENQLVQVQERSGWKVISLNEESVAKTLERLWKIIDP